MYGLGGQTRRHLHPPQTQHRIQKESGAFLDGHCAANNTAFIYQGCYAHGHDPDVCPITAKIKNQKWKARQPQLLRRTQLRAAYIRDQGFNLVEKWECCYNGQEQLGASLEGVAHTDYLPPFCKR